jgi:WD40 repeat protein
VWDADTGREVRTIAEGVGCGRVGEFNLGVGPRTQLEFGPDGKWLLTATSENRPHPTMSGIGAAGPLKLWDAATGQLLRSLDTDAAELLSCLAVSPDGKRVVSARHDVLARSAVLKVSDVETGAAVELENVLGGNDYLLEGIAFSPDGRRIAGATGTAVVLWEAATGQEILRLRSPLVFGRLLSVSFSPDGKRIAAAHSQGMVLVWSATGNASTRNR